LAAMLALTGLSNAGAAEPVPSKCFPAAIDDDLQSIAFPQDHKDAIRKHRNTQVAGYNAAEFRTTVTVFTYEKEPIATLLEEFRASGSEILAVHGGAESPMSGPAKLEVAGETIDGFLGVFLWTEGETDFGSFLWVGEVSGKYVKIRTTYVRPEQDEQTAAAMRFAITAMRKVAGHVCSLN